MHKGEERRFWLPYYFDEARNRHLFNLLEPNNAEQSGDVLDCFPRISNNYASSLTRRFAVCTEYLEHTICTRYRADRYSRRVNHPLMSDWMNSPL